MKSFTELKQRQRDERDRYSTALGLRVHRALSWLHKAEQCDDDDARFIFLWIAFNSAYAQDFDYKVSHGERGLYQEFLSRLVSLDGDQRLANIVWTHYAGSIRLILDNEFILSAFWEFQSGKIDEQQWKQERDKAKAVANRALGNSDTTTVLSILFARLYTLRNQLIHGGATYNSSANRHQLRDCTSVLEQLVPTIIELMMDSSTELWGDPVYPLVNPT